MGSIEWAQMGQEERTRVTERHEGKIWRERERKRVRERERKIEGEGVTRR